MSNQTPKLKLEFDLQDIPWLFHTFTISRNTAMMAFSSSGSMVNKKIEIYIEKINEFSPILANYSIKEYNFFRACAALATCKMWTLYQEIPHFKYERERHWRKPIIFVADDVQHELTQITQEYSPELVKSLIELFQQMAPYTAEYQEHPSIQQPIHESIWDD